MPSYPAARAARCSRLCSSNLLRWVPLWPVRKCDSRTGWAGSVMSHKNTPSSNGSPGLPPHRSGTGSSEVASRLSLIVTCSVQQPGGPSMNATCLGVAGSVTSRIVQPLCHR